jgi:hypothetical protein
MAYLSLAPLQIQIAHCYTHVFRLSVIQEAGNCARPGYDPKLHEIFSMVGIYGWGIARFDVQQ